MSYNKNKWHNYVALIRFMRVDDDNCDDGEYIYIYVYIYNTNKCHKCVTLIRVLKYDDGDDDDVYHE